LFELPAFDKFAASSHAWAFERSRAQTMDADGRESHNPVVGKGESMRKIQWEGTGRARAVVTAWLMAGSAATLAASPMEGAWSGTATAPNWKLDIELSIAGDAGTYHPIVHGGYRGKENPCLGKTYPLTVAAKSDTEVTIDIDMEHVLRGCGHPVITLHPGDDGTWTGKSEAGTVFTLKRH
jgi:hypothetical protein